MRYLIIGLILAATSFAKAMADELKDVKVLLLHSYHPQMKWTQLVSKGVEHEIRGIVNPENFFIEYMDQRRFGDDNIHDSKLIDLLIYKYQKYAPDIVIVSDDYAYQFVLEYGEDLFPETPIIFGGVNSFDPNDLLKRPNITGVVEGLEIASSLRLIRQVQPDVKRIIMLSDNTTLGLNMRAEANKVIEQWQNDPEHNQVLLEIWHDFTLEALFQQVHTLPNDTALLMLAIHKDRKGRYFSYQTEFPILSASASVPVYGMWGELIIGNGGIGGMIHSPFEHGQQVGHVVKQILNGQQPQHIPVELETTYKPRFDYRQLLRFHIDPNRLPINAELYFKPESLYEKYKWLINGTITLILFLLGLISVLLINIKMRVSAQRELASFNHKLEWTIEERTRELSQRNHELKALTHKLHSQAYTDALTGLPNRRAGNEALLKAIKSESTFSLALIDIDHFKKVNDTYGHQVGDDILCEVANQLVKTARKGDVFYRWGGEEFLAIMPDTRHDASAQVCERLRLAMHTMPNHMLCQVTVSIGSTQSHQGDNADEMLKRADERLYFAKTQGRDCVICSPPADTQQDFNPS